MTSAIPSAMAIVSRGVAKMHRTFAQRLARREVAMAWSDPVISFTFDDAPQSAFEWGIDTVQDAEGRATFYCALGLLGSTTEVGRIACIDDLHRARAQGHELGCHTFDHLDAWHTPAHAFLASIDRNAQAFRDALNLIPQSFAYPKSGARWRLKSQVARRFLTCRGGAQGFHRDTADLNLLRACFLDQQAGWSLQDLQRMIDDNQRHRGWLIFATHDVSPHPSPYGCTPAHLKEVVRRSVRSGARLWTVETAAGATSSTAASPTA